MKFKIFTNLLRISKYPKGIKYFFWILLPNLSTLYYRIKWAFYNNIVLVPHFGLGDIAVIIPALKELEKRHKKIYIVGNKNYLNSIILLFKFSDKITIIDFQVSLKTYITGFTQNEKTKLKNLGRVLYLGALDEDPIINYPNSFYIKMGVSIKHSLRKYEMKFHDFTFNEDVKSILFSEKEYNYININTSDGDLFIENPSIIFDKTDKIISFGKSATKIGINNYIDTNTLKADSIEESIINNVFLCLYAKKSIISDAGLFNIVIRYKQCKELLVVTRNHIHSHNNLFYKIQFNGKIQSRCAN